MTAFYVFRHPFRLSEASYRPLDDRGARRFVYICLVLVVPLFVGVAFMDGDPLSEGAALYFMGGGHGFWVHPAVPYSEVAIPMYFSASRWTLSGAMALAILGLPWVAASGFALVRVNGKVKLRAIYSATLTRYVSVGLFPLAAALWLWQSDVVRFSAGIEIWRLDRPLARIALTLMDVALAGAAVWIMIGMPLVLLRRAGGAMWQVGLAGLMHLMQIALVIGLAYVLAVHLPGLFLAYRQLER